MANKPSIYLLLLLGAEHALIVHSADGMDEISPAASKTGVATAQEIIASGAALKLLDDYVKWSQSA